MSPRAVERAAAFAFSRPGPCACASRPVIVSISCAKSGEKRWSASEIRASNGRPASKASVTPWGVAGWAHGPVGSFSLREAGSTVHHELVSAEESARRH